MKKLIEPFGNANYTDLSLLLIRVTFGLTMIIGHGMGKLDKLMSGGEIKFMDFLGLGPEISLGLVVFAEFFCSILLIVGAFTRLATIPLIITMLVAVFMIHFNDPFAKQEKAIMYLIPYVVLLLSGAGKYSVDDKLNG